MIKKSFFGTLKIYCVIAVLCLYSACSTTIPVTYTEPAKLNLSGVKKIAIKSNDTEVTRHISGQLIATHVYTVASAAEIAEWEQWRAETQSMTQLKNHQATAITISSADLVSAYLANTVRADSSYRNRLLRISGAVAEISQYRGHYFARINVGNDSIAIYFAASELNKLASVERGQTITIIGTNYGFNMPDMEDTAEILRILGAGQRINIGDATFPVEDIRDYHGSIDAILTLNKDSRVQDSNRIEKRRVLAKDSAGNVLKDADGKNVYRDVEVTIYERNIAVTIAYQISRIRGGSLIGEGIKSATNKATNEDYSKLPSASTLESNTIGKPLQELTSDIVPTSRTISLTLAKSDDRNAKKEMDAAEKLAKNRNYTGAAEAYGKIYAQYNNFAAGYNQALLTEASQGTEKAIELMTALVEKFKDNSTARSTLSAMRSRDAANKRAAQQLSN